MPPTRGSRYEFAPVIEEEDGTLFVDVPEPFNREAMLRGASTVVVSEGDTPWSLAWRAYRNVLDVENDTRPTALFDIICEANDLVDPLASLPVGRRFLIPSFDVISIDLRVPPTYYSQNRLE